MKLWAYADNTSRRGVNIHETNRWQWDFYDFKNDVRIVQSGKDKKCVSSKSTQRFVSKFLLLVHMEKFRKKKYAQIRRAICSYAVSRVYYKSM